MKIKNIGMILYLLSAVFNVIGIVTFTSGNESGLGFVWICLGSTFLCLGTAYNNKAKKETEEKEKEE